MHAKLATLQGFQARIERCEISAHTVASPDKVQFQDRQHFFQSKLHEHRPLLSS